MSETRQLPPLCRALRLAVKETGVNQSELARRLNEKQTRINRYFNDREPSHAMVGRIERAMDLPSGWLWVHAGYLRLDGSFEQWLDLTDSISEDAKQMHRTLFAQQQASYQARHGRLLNRAPAPSMNESRRASS